MEKVASTRRKTSIHSSHVDLWFKYLNAANSLGLDINWAFYEQWGSKEELTTTKFGTWWKKKGEALFSAPNTDCITLVSSTAEHVVVKIPAHWSVRRVRREIGPVFGPNRNAQVLRGSGNYVLRGRVSYKELIKYQRLFEIDMESHAKGKKMGMKEKLAELKKGEARRIERANKATATAKLKAKKTGARRATKIRAVVVTKPEQRNGYIWLKKARKIAANVAKGEFPGHDYY